MTPALISDPVSNAAGSDVIDAAAKSTSILHRTSWRPPVAVSANGIYIQLNDGTTLIDGVGGASVTCIGNGHPEVVQAIKEQADRMACTSNLFWRS
jgi:4-aminobutyrate aminotransferase-like enzyme